MKLLQMPLLSPTSSLNSANRFYQKQVAGLLFTAILLIFIYAKTGLDAYLIAPYFDVASQSFPLKHQFFLEKIMHLGLKYCMILIALVSLWAGLRGSIHAVAGASVFNQFIGHHQKPFIWAFVGMVVSTSIVSYLKSVSMHGCPNNLTMYGGNLPLFALFEHLPKGITAGHCFPGGHASGGFALMAFYFAFRELKPKFSAVMLALGLVLGFSMGWAQMMRGEHFLSHNLWTAWLVWLVLFALYMLKKLIEKNQ